MLNNKGFAVSTILYTLLIAFLLFLGATLAMFSSSNSIISNANDDLINGIELNPQQVKPVSTDSDGNDNCVPVTLPLPDGKYYWYQVENNILVRITSRYGVMYWPRDFGGTATKNSDGSVTIIANYTNGNIKVEIGEGISFNENVNQYSLTITNNSRFDIIVTDIINNDTSTITLGDICA